ncbi:MAG: S-layer homology domain-containing protein [Bacillota bacterium]
MKKRVTYALICIVLAATVLTPRVAQGYLSDLTGHWAATLVSALEARGVVGGDPQGQFAPEGALTRAQMAKLFAVGLGYEAEAKELQPHASRYKDLPIWHWGRGYAEVISELGLADGFPGGEFRPDEPVTRAQLAVFAVRYAGLTERARLARLEPTPYKDDAEVPEWARGAVFVTRAEGIMTGGPDGYFRPNQPITRAEGAATVFRLLGRDGALFHLAGTLVRYDPGTGAGIVRDSMGQERSFKMDATATYMRQGLPVSPDQVRVLDQVFVVLGDNGRGRFLEARYQDLQVDRLILQNGAVTLTLPPSGDPETRSVQPGALLFLNGRPARLDEFSDAGPAYLAFDQVTGEIRLIDAVKAPIQGTYVGLLSQVSQIEVIVEGERRSYPLGTDPIVVRDEGRAAVADLVGGEQVRLALDEAGRATYIETLR